MARGVAAARAALAGTPLRVGIVGLGAGSLACYAQRGEAWRFYEIDPVVARIATDPKLFDFLDRCRPDPDIVIGDARLTLAQERPESFGYLVIDAFSSDSIPVHLLTAEALYLFVDKLDPDGLLALHVSNNHLDLVPALASTIALVPGVAAAFVDDDRPQQGLDALSSRVVFIARKPAVLARVLQWPDARPLRPGPARPWTDDHSDVLSALVRRLW
jgi:spermidine synthase